MNKGGDAICWRKDINYAGYPHRSIATRGRLVKCSLSGHFKYYFYSLTSSQFTVTHILLFFFKFKTIIRHLANRHFGISSQLSSRYFDFLVGSVRTIKHKKAFYFFRSRKTRRLACTCNRNLILKIDYTFRT